MTCDNHKCIKYTHSELLEHEIDFGHESSMATPKCATCGTPLTRQMAESAPQEAKHEC